MTTDDLLTLHSYWPATTIAGDPGIVAGILSVSASPDGSRLLNLSVGRAGAPPEECEFVEFVLSAQQAHDLAQALA